MSDMTWLNRLAQRTMITTFVDGGRWFWYPTNRYCPKRRSLPINHLEPVCPFPFWRPKEKAN